MEEHHNWIRNALHLTAPSNHELDKSELNYLSNDSFIVESQHILTSYQSTHKILLKISRITQTAIPALQQDGLIIQVAFSVATDHTNRKYAFLRPENTINAL